jgi:hypothetical protein
MAEPTDLTTGVEAAPPGIERAKMILAELADAARSAAVALADEQKARAATEVGVVAAAAREAARSFERSQRPAAAEYADCTARQIEAVAETIRARRWTEIAADVAKTTRRRPALVAAAAVALGFVAGRFWTAASGGSQPPPPAVVQTSEIAVAPTVSSAGDNSSAADRRPPAKARGSP